MTNNYDITLICRRCGNKITATRELFDTAHSGFRCFCFAQLLGEGHTLTKNVIVGGRV